MATWPINELSGLLDPDVFVPGYFPTGTDVGAEIVQVLTKANETVVGANELKVDLDDEVELGDNRDITLAAHAAAIQINLDKSNTNASDITDLEAADVVHTDDIAANLVKINTNIDDIDALEAIVGMSEHLSAADIPTFDFATYGDYSLIVLSKSTSKHAVTLQNPTSSWPLGHRVYFVCRTEHGASITSDYFVPAVSGASFQLCDGDVAMATRVFDNGATSYGWSVVLLPRADGLSTVKEMTVTESYSPPTGFPYRMFTVSGQAVGNVAEVTLPEITDDMVGTELKGFHHGTDGDLRFTCSGTDQILDSIGATGDSIDVYDSSNKAVATLTALPSVSSVYYWGASIDGAFT